jgi:hypothetical protein
VNPEPHRRRAAIACALLGLATLALSIGFFALPAVQAAQGSACIEPLAVQRFQLARTEADISFVFGAPQSACRPVIEAAMNAVNRLDLFAFIPVYAGFLIAAVFMIAPYPRSYAAVAAFVAVALAACGDVLETATQLAITAHIDRRPHPLLLLQIGAWTKYGALAAHGVLVGALALIGSRRNWVIAVLGFAALAATLAASIDPLQRAPWMSAVFVALWLSLLGTAILRIARIGAKAGRAAARKAAVSTGDALD